MENLELLKIPTKKEQNEVMKYMQLEEAINTQIIKIDEQMKQLQDKSKTIKNNLLNSMKKYDLKTLKTDKFTITRVDESTRTTIDSKKLKEELPEIFDKYSKTSTVKASLRITPIKNNLLEDKGV